MIKLSTRQAAKKLGISYATLSTYVTVGKVAPPETVTVGNRIVHMWTEDEVEHVRKLLPKIANGRKTRWQRQRQEKEKAAQALPPVPHRKKKK